MRGPHAALVNREIFPADIGAVDGFEDNGSAGILRSGHGSVPVDGSRTDDTNVIHIVGPDQRAAAWLPTAFPADVHRWIVRGIAAAVNHRVLFEVKGGAVAYLNTADEVLAGRHKHLATAIDGTGIEGFLEGGGVLGGAIGGGA